MTSGYGSGRGRERADPADDPDRRDPASQASGRTAPRTERRASPSVASPVADRMRVAATAVESRAIEPITVTDASAGTSSRTAQDSRLEQQHERVRRRVAGRGEPPAPGHLAGEPADPERDRQPADDGPADPAADPPEPLVGEGATDVGHGAPDVGRGWCVRPLVRGAAARGGSRRGLRLRTGRAGRRFPPGARGVGRRRARARFAGACGLRRRLEVRSAGRSIGLVRQGVRGPPRPRTATASRVGRGPGTRVRACAGRRIPSG